MPETFFIVADNSGPLHLCLDREIAETYAKAEKENAPYRSCDIIPMRISY